MITLFHVTPQSNTESILKNGLIPQLGERSQKMEGEKEVVFMFADYESCEHALWNWLGEEFEDSDEEFITLKIDLPNTFRLDQEAEWEVISRSKIDPQYISFYKNEG